MFPVLYVILIALALALAIYAVVVQRGASIVKLNSKLAASSLAAGVIQLGATIAGYGIGRWFLYEEMDGQRSHYWVRVLAGILLAVVGVRLLLLGFKKQNILEHREEQIDMKRDLVTFLRLCVNAFVAGIAFGILQVQLVLALIAVSVLAVAFVIIGYLSGRAYGGGSSNKAYAIGGGIMCAVGIFLQIFG